MKSHWIGLTGFIFSLGLALHASSTVNGQRPVVTRYSEHWMELLQKNRKSIAAGDIPVWTSRDQFCAQSYFPDTYKALLYDPNNRLAFLNEAGILDTGLCWWHSLLQRSATYLAVYRPDLPKPSPGEVSEIINDLITQRGVVEIPGYANLREFSKEHHSLWIQQLTANEINSSIFELGFIKGIVGDDDANPALVRKMMDELFYEVEREKKVVFQVLQFPGLDAHSWLVVNMKEAFSPSGNRSGYWISFIDSRSRDIEFKLYEYGKPMIFPLEGNFMGTPYTWKNDEIDRFKTLRDAYCDHGVTAKSQREEERSRF